MSNAQPAAAVRAYEAETPGDLLVEALALTSAEADPFNQAAMVAHYLWEHDIVITRSSSALKFAFFRGVVWAGLGAGISGLIWTFSHGLPGWPLAAAWVTFVITSISFLYVRSSKSIIQPFD